MNLVIWDIESSSANTSWGSIIEVGGILVDPNFKELDRFNFRCRLPEGEIPQAMALIVNKTSVDLLTKGNLSHYQMLGQLEAIYVEKTGFVDLIVERSKISGAEGARLTGGGFGGFTVSLIHKNKYDEWQKNMHKYYDNKNIFEVTDEDKKYGYAGQNFKTFRNI